MNGRANLSHAPAVGLVAVATVNVMPTGQFPILAGIVAWETIQDTSCEPMEVSLCSEPVSGSQPLVFGNTDFNGAGLAGSFELQS